MLTSDASNGNFASTMVAEGPAVKLFQSEQEFFAGEFRLLWRWVMGEAVAMGLLPAGFLETVQPHWTFPKLVTRDRPRERLADARLVEARILSRAEIARRDGVDPGEMRREIAGEERQWADGSRQSGEGVMGRGGAMGGRVLWLVFERVPHPEAVCYGARAEDVGLVLELFGRPSAERVRLAGALRNYVREQEGCALLERRWVPVRRASGVYQAVPWRLAKWLACVLGAEEGVIERTRGRLRRWLEGGEEKSLQIAN